MGGEVGVEVIFLIVVVSWVLGLVWKCGFFCHGLRIVKIAYWLRAMSTTALLPQVWSLAVPKMSFSLTGRLDGVISGEKEKKRRDNQFSPTFE